MPKSPNVLVNIRMEYSVANQPASFLPLQPKPKKPTFLAEKESFE